MRMNSQFIVGMGDVNSDAVAKYAAAGYKGVTCAPQTVTYPGGSYMQNQCTDATGQPLSADLASGMTTAQLAAQRTAETNFAAGNANAEIMALTVNPGGGGPAVFPFGPNTNPNPYYTGIYGSGGAPPAIYPTTPTAPLAQTASSSTGGGSQSSPNTLTTPPPATGSDFLSQTVTIAGMTIPVWALLAGGAAALFMFGGRR